MLAKKIALGFGIAVILPILVYYGVSTFSPAPKWGERYERYSYQKYQTATPEERAKIEQVDREKERQWKQKEKIFQKHLFFMTIPVGIASIIIGAALSLQAIGTGLMFGGIFCITEGYVCYWSELPDSMRFLSLLAAFIVLVFVGYKKLAK